MVADVVAVTVADGGAIRPSINDDISTTASALTADVANSPSSSNGNDTTTLISSSLEDSLSLKKSVSLEESSSLEELKLFSRSFPQRTN
jgi:hypothetical protein